MDLQKVHQKAEESKLRPWVEVEPFEFILNGRGGLSLLRPVKRREATFYEVIKFDLKNTFILPSI